MRELFESNLLFDDLLPIAKAWAVELHIRKFFCDPREPEFIKRMRRQRLHAVAAPEELGLARNLLGKRLANYKQGIPGGITISRECPKTIPEFMKYRMPERDPRRPFRDKPLDMDNYGISALHFLILGLANEVMPRVRWLMKNREPYYASSANRQKGMSMGNSFVRRLCPELRATAE